MIETLADLDRTTKVIKIESLVLYYFVSLSPCFKLQNYGPVLSLNKIVQSVVSVPSNRDFSVNSSNCCHVEK